MKINKDKSVKDAFCYAIGVMVPLLINFVKIPIFTRHFTPIEYGYLGIVNTTFQFFIIILYSRIASCVWRYYLSYKKSNNLKKFYSTIFFVNSISSILLVVMAGTWVIVTHISSLKLLILLSIIQTILMQFVGIYLGVEKIEGRALKYNYIYILRALSVFLILILIVFIFNFRIEAMIISEIIINVLLCMYIFNVYNKNKYISIRSISIITIKQFVKFGFPSVVCNLCLLVLTVSDRYIIQYFYDFNCVGIYNEIYKISEISIYCLIGVYFNAINPVLLQSYEEDINKSNNVIKVYVKKYIMLILPFAVYFSMFSKEIATILLGEKFRIGYTMMPYVMITAFIYGLSQFNQDKFKYGNKMNVLVKGFIISSLLNIVLNIVFVPSMGYKFSAVTTLIAYLVLYLYYYFMDDCRYIRKYSDLKSYFCYGPILIIQILVDFFIRKIIYINVIWTIIEGIAFLLIYILYVYIKEFKEPVKNNININ